MPLKRKRDEPRRNEGRIRHQRIKPRAGAPPDVAEKRHRARVGAMGCLVCGRRPATIHHVSAGIYGGRIARSHKRIVPLCNFAPHHQKVYERRDRDPQSVEGLGHGGFFRKYGINLLAEADRLWLESCALETG